MRVEAPDAEQGMQGIICTKYNVYCRGYAQNILYVTKHFASSVESNTCICRACILAYFLLVQSTLLLAIVPTILVVPNCSACMKDADLHLNSLLNRFENYIQYKLYTTYIITTYGYEYVRVFKFILLL